MKCGTCQETDPSKFYGNKTRVCAKCHNEYTKALGKKKREYALNILGGKCVSCGFDKYPESLDIHHTDPKVKDSNFASMRGWSYSRIDKEVESCVLLCRNCHSAFHNGHPIVW